MEGINCLQVREQKEGQTLGEYLLCIVTQLKLVPQR